MPGRARAATMPCRAAEAKVKKEDEFRDKALEKLLAERLRQQMRPRAAGCPEPETIAAYVDGTLPARERAEWESHFAACSRCQGQVATLVRWSEQDEPSAPRVAAPAHRRAFKVLRWAWAAPTLVAVLVAGLWYTGEFRGRLRQTQEPHTEVRSPVTAPATQGQVAEDHKRNAVPARALPQPQPQPQVDAADLSKDIVRKQLSEQGAPEEVAAESAAPVPPAMQELGAAARPALPAQAAEAKSAGMIKPSERARMAAVGAAPGQLAEPEVHAPETLEAGRGRGTASNVAPGAASRKAEVVAPAPAALSAVGAKDERKGEKRPLALAAGSAWMARQAMVARDWRVGAHGLIQRVDANGNWLTIPSGVQADLYDIAFSSRAIGWVVGQGGILLRTTDGGHTWKQIPSPTDEDLVKVMARTDTSARIETRSHKVWETTNSGGSWTRSPAE